MSHFVFRHWFVVVVVAVTCSYFVSLVFVVQGRNVLLLSDIDENFLMEGCKT